MDKKNAALVKRLQKYITEVVDKKPHGQIEAAKVEMAEALRLKAPGIFAHWLGTKRIPGYHEELLDKFLLGKGY